MVNRKRSRSRQLWQWLMIPSTAISSMDQPVKRTPSRIRAYGLALRKLIKSRSVSARGLEHKEEAIPPSSSHAVSSGKRPWNRLCINPGESPRGSTPNQKQWPDLARKRLDAYQTTSSLVMAAAAAFAGFSRGVKFGLVQAPLPHPEQLQTLGSGKI